VAAGLCIYFIASSVWGFAERRLLPKFKPDAGAPVSSEGLFQKLLARAQAAQTAQTGRITTAGGVTQAAAVDRGRGKQRGKRRPERVEPAGGDGLLSRLRAWWADVLDRAQKK
jgi:hypothetical protein